MRVCILTTAFPCWPDDDQAPFIWAAAKALNKTGMAVSVIAMHIPGTKTYETWDGIEIYRPRYLPERFEVLRKEGGGLPVVWKKMPLARLALIPYILVTIFLLVRLRENYDVIHANWTLSGMIAWVSQFLHRKPYVVTVHGSDIYEGGKIGVIRKLTSIALNRASRVVAVSNSLARNTLEMGIKQKITVIPDGVNVEHFSPLHDVDKDRDFILFAGSLIPRKGLQYLLSAFQDIIKDYPNLRLIVIGDGPLRSAHETQAAAAGLSGSIEFLGWQKQIVVRDFMRHASIFVLPSLNEGLGVVLLEALSSGTPCAGSNVDGIPDVITSDVGVLFPPADPVAISRSVKQILSDPSRYKQMQLAARQRAISVYDWQVIAAQLKEVFQEVCFCNREPAA